MGRIKESTLCIKSTKGILNYYNYWGREDYQNAKILILGTDPTAPNSKDKNQAGLTVKNIKYPFGLQKYELGQNNFKNSYFRSIYNNLVELIDKDADIVQFFRDNVIVMNAVDALLYDTEIHRYITTGQCFQRAGNRRRWTEYFHKSDTKKEIQKKAKGKLVLLTSRYLLECFGDDLTEKEKKELNYSSKMPECFCRENNSFGADIALLYRHYKYNLRDKQNQSYARFLREKYKMYL